MKSKRLVIASGAALLISTVLLIANTRGTPNQLRVSTDANGALLVASSAVSGSTTTQVFSNSRLATDSSGNLLVTDGSAHGFAPADAKYLVQTSNASLPNAQVMGSLSSGLMGVTTTTGVVSSIANVAAGKVLVSNGTGSNPTYTNIPQLTAGTGTSKFGACGTIGQSYNVVNTAADTNEDTIYSFTIPANTLVNVGDVIKWYFLGVTGANTDSKTYRIRYSGTSGTVITSLTVTSSTNLVTSGGWIAVTGTNTQRGTGQIFVGTSTPIGAAQATSAVTTTADSTLLITAQNNSNPASAAQGLSMRLEFCTASPQ